MRELFVSLACGLGYLLLAGKLVEDDAFTQGTFVLSGLPACCLRAAALCLEKRERKTACRQPPVSARDAIAVLALVAFESTYNMALTERFHHQPQQLSGKHFRLPGVSCS